MQNLSYKEQKRMKIVKNLSKDWMIDTQHEEIRRKTRPWYIHVWYFLIFKRYTVRELYTYVYDYFHCEANIHKLMPISFPMDHDNIKKPKDVPFNFVMLDKWEIPDEDAKILMKGPLISSDGSRTIVSNDSPKALLGRWFRRSLAVVLLPGGIYATVLAFQAMC
ncbi:hypothetical protein ACFLVR_04200 [Chloroflexota bacterium]